ncbi:Uncharacterised protein [Klebsiella pneumoniae]|nr:Uncharacterised protein [Klebsiella pneumoniae]
MKKFILSLIAASSLAACTIVDYPQKKEEVKKVGIDDIKYFVRNGIYQCEYLVIAGFDGASSTTVDNGRVMLVKIGRVDDYVATMSVALSNGAIYSSKNLQLRKPDGSGTQYFEDPDYLGNSGRPGMTFKYNYLDNGGFSVAIGMVFVDGFSSMSIQTNWCKEVDIKK